MKNYYSSNPTFYLGIDCIIFGFNEGEISLLLLKRNFEPAMGEWKTYTWNRWEPSAPSTAIRAKG